MGGKIENGSLFAPSISRWTGIPIENFQLRVYPCGCRAPVVHHVSPWVKDYTCGTHLQQEEDNKQEQQKLKEAKDKTAAGWRAYGAATATTTDGQTVYACGCVFDSDGKCVKECDFHLQP
jgi:hypothetical protein